MRSDGVLKFNAASLYLLLYRMEKRGWFVGYLETKDNLNIFASNSEGRITRRFVTGASS